jgi:hypothetical protein
VTAEKGVRYRVPVKSRHAQRAGVVCAVTSLSLLAASPAFALVRDDGDDPGPAMTRMEGLLVFVGIPLGSLMLIWIVCSAMKSSTPRPGHTVQGPPIWYMPADEHGHIGHGIHQDPALTSGGDAHGGGGTSARY